MEDEAIRPVSARKATRRERIETVVSMRFPADVIEDLKRVAPLRGFTDYQPLIRAYVGRGFARIWRSLKRTPWPSWWRA